MKKVFTYKTTHFFAHTFEGVDPNLCGKGTSPPLLLAAKAGHYDVIRVLREHKDKNGSDQTIATTDFAILDPTDGSTVLVSFNASRYFSTHRKKLVILFLLDDN
jgi:hypothetical protein